MSVTSPSRLPTPEEIIARLDQTVIAQEQAKRKLAEALWWNQYRQELARQGFDLATLPPRQNVLLVGPPGCGKSLLARTAAESLGLPFLPASAPSFAAAGYSGRHVEELITGLYRLAGNDIARAERGIVLLDELDRLRRRDLGCDDVGGAAVQQALLTLLSGEPVAVKDGEERKSVNTEGITFLAAGVFEGLEERILRRGRGGYDIEEDSLAADALRQVEADDLIGLGFLPEFVARFPVRVGLRALSRDDLRTLALTSTASPIRQLARLLELHGIALEVDSTAIEAVLDLAEEAGNGARGVNEVLVDRLGGLLGELPQMLAARVTRVLVDVSTVLDRRAPWKIAGEPEVSERVDLEKVSCWEFEPVVPTGISNTRGWPAERVRSRIVEVRGLLDYERTTGSARKWWDSFEQENQGRLSLILRLAEELARRKATITEFFLAYVYSNTDNIQANLHYLDYSRLKKEAERKKKDQARRAARRFRSGDTCPKEAAGAYRFDGELSGKTEQAREETPPEISMTADQVFPESPAGRACWWKRIEA